MARINIEDKLFKDTRYIKLVLKVGCEHKALGLLCGAWVLAQSNWLKFKSIPIYSWPKDYNVLVETEFASILPDGNIYIKGSKKAFAWLTQISDAGKQITPKRAEQLRKARASKAAKKISKNNDFSVNSLKNSEISEIKNSDDLTNAENISKTCNNYTKTSERGLNGSERGLNGSEVLTPSLSLSLNKEEMPPEIENNFFTKDFSEINNYLITTFGPHYRHKTKSVLDIFQSYENFANWVIELENSYNKSKKTGDFKRYLGASLAKEIDNAKVK